MDKPEFQNLAQAKKGIGMKNRGSSQGLRPNKAPEDNDESTSA